MKYLIKITKDEMEYLCSSGVKFGEYGISHTNSCHRRTYYLTESGKNLALLDKYRKSKMVK